MRCLTPSPPAYLKRLAGREAIRGCPRSPAKRGGRLPQSVAQTGNQGLAAARAKVLRNWVTMTRAAEPAFDAAVLEAGTGDVGLDCLLPPFGLAGEDAGFGDRG